MSVTLDTLAGRIYRLLEDPDQQTYSEELVYDGVIGAHDAVLHWVPCKKVATLTATSGSGASIFELPADLFEIESVITASTGNVMSSATLSAGTSRGNPNAENDWLRYPNGYLSVSNALSANEVLTLYYIAFWPKPADETDVDFVIKVPAAAHQGMIYYAASHATAASSVPTAQIRQFATKVDAGTPIHNPLKDISSWFMERFFLEMKMLPTSVKASSSR